VSAAAVSFGVTPVVTVFVPVKTIAIAKCSAAASRV